MSAASGDVAGDPDGKQWWRNLDAQPAVEVLHERRWRPARAVLLRPRDPSWAAARAAYADAHPGVLVPDDAPLVVLTPSDGWSREIGTLDPRDP